MCVCTSSSGSRSLTKFKVDEDSPNKNSRHLRSLSLKYLSTCNNGYSYQSKHQIPQSGTFEQTVELIAACLFVLGRSYECITGIVYAQTHIHAP